MRWSVVYKQAIQKDGSLLFPERLTSEFLEQAKRTMGSYVFANQYQNEIIPEGDQRFKKEWLRYYKSIPELVYRFAFIDPAISQSDTADYTGIVVVAVDSEQKWYVEHARRSRLNPTQIIQLGFELAKRFECQAIGVESVAYQQALIYLFHEEMQKRNVFIPITPVTRGPSKTKEMRILSLVPRFEWGNLFLSPNLYDLELELAQFPRGAHDDILDSLSSIEDIAYYPTIKRSQDEAPPPTHADYESWYRKQLSAGKSHKQRYHGGDF